MELALRRPIEFSGGPVMEKRPIEHHVIARGDPRNEVARKPLTRIDLHDEIESFLRRTARAHETRGCRHDADPIVRSCHPVFDLDPGFALFVIQRPAAIESGQTESRRAQRNAQRRHQMLRNQLEIHGPIMKRRMIAPRFGAPRCVTSTVLNPASLEFPTRRVRADSVATRMYFLALGARSGTATIMPLAYTSIDGPSAAHQIHPCACPLPRLCPR